MKMVVTNSHYTVELHVYCNVEPCLEKLLPFSVCQQHSLHIVFIKLRFFFFNTKFVFRGSERLRAQKLLLDILCSKFSRLLTRRYADY